MGEEERRNRWFRFYDEALDDPKVQFLSDADFKQWVNLLCLANRNGGKFPSIETIAFGLRLEPSVARSLVDRLADRGLIDTLKGGANGSTIAPHSWGKRQYKSDSSTERVKRFRNGNGNVSETPRARQKQNTEKEEEQERKNRRGLQGEEEVFSSGGLANPARAREGPSEAIAISEALLQSRLLNKKKPR